MRRILNSTRASLALSVALLFAGCASEPAPAPQVLTIRPVTNYRDASSARAFYQKEERLTAVLSGAGWQGKSVRVRIVDSAGKQVHQTKPVIPTGGNAATPIPALKPGTYYARAVLGDFDAESSAEFKFAVLP